MSPATDRVPRYQQIAEAIRRQILYGQLQPGDALPTVRELAAAWDCTQGTVQKAYQELMSEGLVVSQPGRGTRVGAAPPAPAPTNPALRRASLVNQAEAFLLQAVGGGYTPDEVESALRSALDRFRSVSEAHAAPPQRLLRFAGSHDPALSIIAGRFSDIAPGYMLRVAFTGSLGGLIALAEGGADMAGSHLWDEYTNSYNEATVRRVLPGQAVALLTLARRRLGLIMPAGNPGGVTDLADAVSGRLHFINRQRGAGTRVWLEAAMQRSGLVWDRARLPALEVTTHSETARAVAEGRGDVGVGIETAALSYGLGFLHLTTEVYELVIPEGVWEHPAVQALAQWLATGEAKALVAALGGYEVGQMGSVRWVNHV